MQWVSFDPLELAGRPESTFIDPLSQQRSLTVRNASMYGNNRFSNLSQIAGGGLNYSNNNNSNPRMSMFGGSNVSDTNTDDSGSCYSGPGSKRISAALATRQQRRSIRFSQDSQHSLSGKAYLSDGSLPLPSSVEADEAGDRGNGAESSNTVVTKVLPVIAAKITKPTVAKVINQRGSRVGPGAGLLGDHEVLLEEDGTSDGLGIDFSGFGIGDHNLTQHSSNLKTKTTPPSNSIHSSAYQNRRPSSTLNPSHNRGTNPNNNSKQEGKLSAGQYDSGNNVLLKMPPPPRDGTGENGDNGSSHPSDLRHSIMELDRDMPGFLNYGDNL
ncbi:hypothetical protein BGZ65_002961 [Modicella reniformis]|uniref:Uncharacterized protein n=1 Tax=Modicella reniformis TaxID=1440133 RepID=A0A9P6SU56_9FUNG|nr:hypothetical protein BGZ65_002961 [Modicella reniformis]